MTFNLTKIVSVCILIGVAIYSAASTQNTLGLFLILTLGLLHGCNDLTLLKTYARESKTLSPYVWYVIFAALAIVLFLFAPIVVFIAFGLMSCYHFGEQHWAPILKKKTVATYLLSFTTGLSILALIFVLNTTETQSAIAELFGLVIPATAFLSLLLLSVLSTGFLALNVPLERTQRASFIGHVVSWLLLFTVFAVGNLMLSFACYFVFYHSLPAIRSQLEKQAASSVKQSFIQFLKQTWYVWLITLVGCGILYVFVLEEQLSFAYYTLGFLMAIASSHTVLFHKFHTH